MTTNLARVFVTCIPTSEEEMLDICREIASHNPEAENSPDFSAHFDDAKERIQQLLSVMESFSKGEVKEDVDPVNHDCPLCKKKAAGGPAEIPPEEAAVTPALTEIDDEEDCGCGEDCDCEDCKAKREVEEQVQESAPVDTGLVRVLTLATSHEIKSQYVGQQKTTLSTSKLQVDEDRVRFKFNSFEHVLPIQLASHKATVVNEAHEFGTQTVRLVLSFNGKTLPTLVDLVEGEEDVLSIGTDLYEILRKDRDDVSPK